jgi:hypothetical protein
MTSNFIDSDETATVRCLTIDELDGVSGGCNPSNCGCNGDVWDNGPMIPIPRSQVPIFSPIQTLRS